MDTDNLWSVVSALAGVAGVIIAIFAKLDSKRANKISERSDQRAAESVTLAQKSNSIAIDARELAEEANTISRRAEERETELNYVSWDYHWKDAATCNVINTGKDKALSALITVAVNGEYLSHPKVDLEPGRGVRITLPILLHQVRNNAEEFRAEQRDFRARATAHYERSSSYGIAPLPFLEPTPVHIPLTFDVRITIQWRTPLGTQREQILEEKNCTFSLID